MPRGERLVDHNDDYASSNIPCNKHNNYIYDKADSNSDCEFYCLEFYCLELYRLKSQCLECYTHCVQHNENHYTN